jgi:hypothetical protein
VHRDKVVANRILTETEVRTMMDASRRMHTPCSVKKEKLDEHTFPLDDPLHTSPADYKHHLQLRNEWLAVLCSMLSGIVHPRLPGNTGDLVDIQAKAGKELQKFLFGTAMSVEYHPDGSDSNAVPKHFHVPPHNGNQYYYS